ncbi:MAG TPA: 2-succinyl-6-hydroxy-2,4-cyclohexadiene-1-carboxylate synthase [Solirubrobacteraceae bacterium]|nr:2-succinyl-6-hydroxy-2,4-cyclohexadiene-1-carboxylate synthase [Solirubrobacteraceae bacterium]
MPESVVLLHGFSGTGRAWDGVAARLERQGYRPLAPDLLGHGTAAECERPITFGACVAHLLAQAPERFALYGYSLGGRVALHLALSAPDRVGRLVLVSTTPGIEDASERTERRHADHLRADELETMPFEQFIERWRSQPLFAQDPPEVDRLAREDQRRNRPDALAAVLRGIGTGEMQSLWERLAELTMPVTVVVGERDDKFRALGERMVRLLPDARLTVVSGGHNLPLENPSALAGLLD